MKESQLLFRSCTDRRHVIHWLVWIVALLCCVMGSIVMTILVAKTLLMGVCVLSGLKSLLRWACHLDAFLRQSATSRGDRIEARVEVCDVEKECEDLPSCNVQQSSSPDSNSV